MNKLCFVYLLQAGERNFSPHIHTTWEEPFSAALYAFPSGHNVCQLKTFQRRREPGGHAEVSLLPRRRRLSLARPHKSRSAIRTRPEKEGNDRCLQIKRLYKASHAA